MIARFVVHRHSTGKTHFDLRLVQDSYLRCWSLMREPPTVPGQTRLAIERESFEPAAIDERVFEEQAFGCGRVRAWDEGTVEISSQSSRELILHFSGARLSGRYELRRTRWYPGNRWLLQKTKGSGSAADSRVC